MCRYYIYVVVIAACMGCSTTRQAGTHDFADGYYWQAKKGTTKEKVYLQVADTMVTLYALQSDGHTPEALPRQGISLFPHSTEAVMMDTRFIKRSVDVDVSTILFKYRFATGGVPAQLNSNLNVALYSGYRLDFFTLKEQRDPLKQRSRRVRHFEMDMGVFAGIGSTAINPSTTHNVVSLEYDGVIFQKGVAVFFGTHSFTLGIGLGMDNLLGKDKKNWIYRDKPWLGVMIGLNITN